MTGKAPGTERAPQVQIRLRGADGEWYQPAYHPTAVLAALRAIREDIQECSGSYPPDKLREIREAADQLSATAVRLGGTPGA